MSISGQQNINVGLPNESPNSDSLYTAFTKTQQNFNQLFACATPYPTFINGSGINVAANAITDTVVVTNTGVTDIVAGDNIHINQSTGIVTISASGNLVVDRALTANTVIDSAQPNITSVGTLTSLSVTGNITGANLVGNHYGNGYALGAITGANVTGAVANAIAATSALFVTNPSQPYVTSVGTLTVLNVNGNITAPNITANIGSFYGNGSGLTHLPAANIVGALNIPTNSYANTVSNAAQPNITSVGTLTSLSVIGNITGANLTGNHYGNGAGLTNLSGASVVGTVPAATTSITASTVTTPAQANITSVGTLSSLAVSGNVSSGNINGGNLVQGTFLQGTLTTAAQPNITSVGTLAGLSINGTLTAQNITANPGTFTGDGSGLFSLNSANLIGPLNTSVLGSSTLYVGNTGIALNRPSGSLALTGITSIDGYSTTVSSAAQPNITSVGTLTSLSVSGTATASTIVSTVSQGVPPLSVTSNTVVANLNANLINGYTTSTSASASTLVLRDINGNITGNYLVGDGSRLVNLPASARLANGTSNIAITNNGNIQLSVGGNANLLTVTTSSVINNAYTQFNNGATFTGAVTLGSVGNVVITGGSSGYVLTTDGSGGLTWTSVSNANSANVANTVSNPAQPNITSVGSLVSLNSSGNITGPNVIANTGAFYGNGAGLTYVPGVSVVGTVASANIAGTANFVAGANVTGTVANAIYATRAGSATTATTATSVASITSTQVTTALGYTPYNSSNPSSYIGVSSFTQSLSSNGWCRLPNGLLMQWGFAGPYGTGTHNLSYPIPFSGAAYSLTTTEQTYNTTSNKKVAVYSLNSTYATMNVVTDDSGGYPSTISYYWSAIGPG